MTEILHDRFEVLRSLGGGAMGVVVEARDRTDGRHVALKLLRTLDLMQPETVQRFRREAHTLSRLHHPHIVEFRGFFEPPPVLVLELLQGESVRNLLRRERALSPTHACSIATEITRGLAAAHAQGVVHRDIKPSNLFLAKRADHTVAKLIDFGVAKQSDRESPPLTAQSAVVGSALYMAPEQIRGEPAEERSDLFALGLCLYEMITGERPFAEANLHQAMVHILNGDPLPQHQALPAGLYPVLLRATSRERERRFQDAADFARALAPFTQRQLFRTQLSAQAEEHTDPNWGHVSSAMPTEPDGAPPLDGLTEPTGIQVPSEAETTRNDLSSAPDSQTRVQSMNFDTPARNAGGTLQMPAQPGRTGSQPPPRVDFEEPSPSSMTRPLANLPPQVAARFAPPVPAAPAPNTPAPFLVAAPAAPSAVPLKTLAVVGAVAVAGAVGAGFWLTQVSTDAEPPPSSSAAPASTPSAPQTSSAASITAPLSSDASAPAPTPRQGRQPAPRTPENDYANPRLQ